MKTNTTKQPRFSKATLAAHIQTRVQYLVKTYGIDESNGTSQCAKKSTEFAIAFGEYRALRDIWNEYELAYVEAR